jgi:hypothetical protein
MEYYLLPKNQGGLGIKLLELKNKCSLGKWLFILLSKEGMWQQLVHNKYLKNKVLPQFEAKPVFFKGFMRVKNNFLARGVFEVENETTVFGKMCG